MSSEAEQRYNFSCLVYAAFCRGRLAADPAPNYGAAEVVSHALGVEEMGKPLPGMAAVIQMVAQLMSESDAAETGKPTPSPAPRTLSTRVLKILGELGLDPDQFHRRGATTPTSVRAQLARRAVILRLCADGLSVNEVAAATLLDPWTVRAHLRAARQPSA